MLVLSQKKPLSLDELLVVVADKKQAFRAEWEKRSAAARSLASAASALSSLRTRQPLSCLRTTRFCLALSAGTRANAVDGPIATCW